MRNKSIIFIIALVIIFITNSCKDEEYENCDSEIAGLISEYGPPDEVQKYDSDGYHKHDYWYWCLGYQQSFIWGDKKNCEVSQYVFEPICGY